MMPRGESACREGVLPVSSSRRRRRHRPSRSKRPFCRGRLVLPQDFAQQVGHMTVDERARLLVKICERIARENEKPAAEPQARQRA